MQSNAAPMFPISKAQDSQVKAFPVGIVLMIYILVLPMSKNKTRSSHLYTFFPMLMAKTERVSKKRRRKDDAVILKAF